MAGKKEKVVHCWDKTGLLGAWLQQNGVEAVTRAAELFPNLRAERRGVDDAPPADPERARHRCGSPARLPQRFGRAAAEWKHLPAGRQRQRGNRAARGGGVDQLGCRGRGGTGLVVAVPHVITNMSLRW